MTELEENNVHVIHVVPVGLGDWALSSMLIEVMVIRMFDCSYCVSCCVRVKPEQMVLCLLALLRMRRGIINKDFSIMLLESRVLSLDSQS